MDLVDDAAKLAKNQAAGYTEAASRAVENELCINTAISLMSNIVEIACDYERDLCLMRLVNFMDLYRTYLQLANNTGTELNSNIASISGPSTSVVTQTLGHTTLVSFERFIRDSRLLGIAAAAATRESGEHVVAPAPLCLSAND